MKKNTFKYTITAKNLSAINYVKSYFTPEYLGESDSIFTYVEIEDDPRTILVESTENILHRIIRKRLEIDVKNIR